MIIKQKLQPLIIITAVVFSMQTHANDILDAGSNPNTVENYGGGVFKDNFNSDDPCAHNKRNIGVAIGTIAGAIIGNIVSKNKHKALGTIVGGVAGAGLGGFIGYELDNRQCELSKIQKKYDANIQTTLIKTNAPDIVNIQTNEPAEANNNTVGLSVNVVDKDNEPQFDSGSEVLTTKSQALFTEIATQYKPQTGADEASKKVEVAARNRRVLLIGHTDDTGSSSQNAELSERRARNVATLFKNAGVPENQIYYQGAGETLPQADNATETGRAKNRRVEIVDLSNDENFNLYLQNRRPNTEYYREVDPQVSVSSQEKPTEDVSEKTVATNKTAAAKNDKKLTKIQIKQNKTIVTSADKSKSVSIIDFGGTQANSQNAAINIGEVQTKPKFAFINEAQANNMQNIAMCNMDRPRSAGGVKSLKDGKIYTTNEHLPGLNGRSWQDMVNGHLIIVNHVAVLRDGAVLENNPELKVYTNYNPSQNRNPKPDVSITPSVNVYQGSNGVLYRVFANGVQGLQCMDILMPLSATGIAKSGKVIYGANNNLQVADFIPKIVK